MTTDKPAPAVWGLHLPGAANSPAVRNQQRQQPPLTPPHGKPTGEEVVTSPAAPASDVVAGIQQRQAERDRLLSLCQQLRRQHRCPGRCVLTGELRRGGLAAFRSTLDGLV